MGSKERVYYQMPQELENLAMGLSNRARNHLVRYRAWADNNPIVEEMINVHGVEADELGQVLKQEGNNTLVLKEGRRYAMRNSSPKSPTGADPWIYRTHDHSLNDLI